MMSPVDHKYQVWQDYYHQEEPAEPIFFHILVVFACDVEHSYVDSDSGDLQGVVLHGVKCFIKIRFIMELHK